MTHIERIQDDGRLMLQSSGWGQQKIDALVECLVDFTSQAFSDEMYKDAKLELWNDEQEQTLDIIWQTDHLDVRVILYDEIAAHWDLFAGKIVDGVKVEEESSGEGGNCRFLKYKDAVTENEKWAFHFYWWLEDYLKPQSDNN